MTTPIGADTSILRGKHLSGFYDHVMNIATDLDATVAANPFIPPGRSAWSDIDHSVQALTDPGQGIDAIRYLGAMTQGDEHNMLKFASKADQLENDMVDGASFTVAEADTRRGA